MHKVIYHSVAAVYSRKIQHPLGLCLCAVIQPLAEHFCGKALKTALVQLFSQTVRCGADTKIRHSRIAHQQCFEIILGRFRTVCISYLFVCALKAPRDFLSLAAFCQFGNYVNRCARTFLLRLL